MQAEHGDLLGKYDKLEDQLRNEVGKRRKAEAELTKVRQLQSLSAFFDAQNKQLQASTTHDI